MTRLHLNTAVFTTPKSSRTGRRATKGALRSRLKEDLVVTQGLDAETVRIHLEVKAHNGGLVIVVETPDGEDWSEVAPERLKKGLLVIFQRESQLERTAARYGLPADALLEALADSIVDLSDESAGLPEAELEVLQAAGVSLEGSPTDPSGAGQAALGLAKSQQFRAEALTVAEAAKELNVSDSRVRQLVSANAVMTIPNGDSGHLLPAWQFVGGRTLPGLVELTEAAAGLHPLTMAGFMTRPDVDLEVDGEPVSPIEWLVAGGDPAVVADLIAGLRVPA